MTKPICFPGLSRSTVVNAVLRVVGVSCMRDLGQFALFSHLTYWYVSIGSATPAGEC